MTADETPIVERGLLSMSEEAWELARRRSDVIAPLAALGTVGHQAADDAAEQLSLSRCQVYSLVTRYRQGSGVVTDVAPGRSRGGRAVGGGANAG